MVSTTLKCSWINLSYFKGILLNFRFSKVMLVNSFLNSSFMEKRIVKSLLNFFCGSLVLTLLFTITFRLDVKAQDKRRVEKFFVHISDTRQKVIDLTKRVEKECTQSLVANVGSTQIEIKFSPSLSSTAEQTLSVTKRSIEITQSIRANALKL